jgi:phospho-N-acetylmuramoyl-pentapeptide-transferase
MGDTGSLFIGAFLISILYSVKKPTAFFSLGAVFILEGISVILQVLFYKLRGRRLFLMSPLHHHLEKRGYTENQICIMAIILTVIASLPILIFEAL